MEASSALLFTAYMVPVNLMDNILKPIVMGRGLATPMPVILIGVIGGTLVHVRRDLAVEQQVIGRVHRHHLALEMGRQLGDRDADVGKGPLDLVAIAVARGGEVHL